MTVLENLIFSVDGVSGLRISLADFILFLKGSLCLSAKAVYCSRQPAWADTNELIALTPEFSLVCRVSF